MDPTHILWNCVSPPHLIYKKWQSTRRGCLAWWWLVPGSEGKWTMRDMWRRDKQRQLKDEVTWMRYKGNEEHGKKSVERKALALPPKWMTHLHPSSHQQADRPVTLCNTLKMCFMFSCGIPGGHFICVCLRSLHCMVNLSLSVDIWQTERQDSEESPVQSALWSLWSLKSSSVHMAHVDWNIFVFDSW